MTRVVMLRPEVIDPASGDGFIMRDHGLLWVYERTIADPDDAADDRRRHLHWYKAVATGHKHMWFDHEIEEHNHG